MVEIELTRPDRLTPADWQTWRQLQQADPALDSPNFRPEFTQAVAAVRSDVEVALLRVGGETEGFLPFQRGTLNLGKPVGGKLSDYHGAIASRELAFDPERIVRAANLAGWDFDHLVASQTQFLPFARQQGESPYLDLTEGYEAYAAGRRKAGSDTLARLGQKMRKFERECGQLRFEWDEPTDEVLETLRGWKSAQLVASGLADVFAFPWTSDLLRTILDRSSPDFGATVATLRAGETLVAMCYSMRGGPVLHSWFTAYDPQFAVYSPGLILFDQMARTAVEQAVTKIDLGKGDERYKRSLASATTPLIEGSVELNSPSVWLRSGWRRARGWMESSRLGTVARQPVKLIQPLREWLALH
jgi:CelD/BcsL family acetyltransferase involved in cellulose biosynthesis